MTETDYDFFAVVFEAFSPVRLALTGDGRHFAFWGTPKNAGDKNGIVSRARRTGED